MDVQEIPLGDRAGSHEIPAATEATGDQCVMDSAVLPAVERMQSLQAKGRDVVSRVVDERDHQFGIRFSPIGYALRHGQLCHSGTPRIPDIKRIVRHPNPLSPRNAKRTKLWSPEEESRIIPLLNYLTSKRGVPTMSSSGKKGKPDACDILANLWQLIQSVLDDSEPDMEALGLSPKAFFLLAAILEHPFPAEIARRMHLPPPTVTYLVKQLEEKGFLERRAEPGDLRKFRLVQTVAGREALDQGQEILGLVLGQRLRRLDREEIITFDKIVKRLAGRNGGGVKP